MSSLKDKVITGLLVVGGLFSGKKAAAQALSSDDLNMPSVAVTVDTLNEDTLSSVPIEKDEVKTDETVAEVTWDCTSEGQEAINAYKKAMLKIGESGEISQDDMAYLRALSNFNREMAMIDGTEYKFDKDDLLGVIPDSLQNKLADDASKWITPAAYVGNGCNHAVKGNLLSNGLLLSAHGVSPACDMENYYKKDINFVGVEIDAYNDCYAANGTTKVYRSTKGHPYGHIGVAVKSEGSELSKDSSDKLRNNINEKNYSGVVCFFTSHSKASLETCIAAWATKYKREHMPKIMTANADITSIRINVTAKQVFETAVSCKKDYFEKYNIALNNMKQNHKSEGGYIIGPSIKTPLLARNAQRVGKSKKPAARNVPTRKAPTRR